MHHYTPISPASIEWQDGLPFSGTHSDIYFSREGGLDETHYVFIEGNALPTRWRDCSTFTIAETGFGTGLNFLCTAKLWLQNNSSGHLHFVSAEKHPLTADDLTHVLLQWPELKSVSDELTSNYPPLTYGYHRRDLFGGRISLTLMFGDATEMFTQLNASVDAWFLDGFAPSKNPDMWETGLLKQITRLTREGGSFATFTAAGTVRRGLQDEGFDVNIRPGFGRKRDMLIGRLSNKAEIASPQPWFYYTAQPPTHDAIVIGGGIAGSCASHSLARRGWQVTLIERHAELAQEASGNHAGVVMPRLTADMGSDGQFYLSAFLYTIDWLNRFKTKNPELPWHSTGVVQLCNKKQQQRLAKLDLPERVLQIIDQPSASIKCGNVTNSGGLFYPEGGWLEPPALCNALIASQRDNIRRCFQQKAITLKRNGNYWQVLDSSNNTVAESATIIICNGYHVEEMLGVENRFSLIRTRGQLAYLPATTKSGALKTPVCYDGYLIPAHNDLHVAGATYSVDDNETQCRDEDEQKIIAELENALPGFETTSPTQGRVAFRSSTEDHLPLIGPLPDIDFYGRHYVDLHHGRPVQNYHNAAYLPGLYISCGHGSRGLISAPFAAETIAATINNEPLPAPVNLLNAVHPARFMIRKLKRKR